MSNSCKKIMISTLFGTSLLIFLIQGIHFLESYSFKEKEYIIKNVSYPLSIEDSSNLIKCDCGRYCTSDAGTCIKIEGNLMINSKQSARKFLSSTIINGDNKGCTFAETRCKDGEKIENRLESISLAQVKAQKFIEKMNNNSPITCYQRAGDSYLYLEKNDNSIIFYICCSLVILSTSCLFCVFCSCDCCKDKEENKSAFI